MLGLFNKFNSPPDDITGGGSPDTTTPNNLNKEDVIEFLSEDDEDKEVLELEEKKDKDKDKDKEKEKGKKKSSPEKKDEKTSDTESDDDNEDDEIDDEEEQDELEELELEIEGPTEEQLELVTPVRRKEILNKYPTLFKDFPYLEKAYYREQQFTEIFPTINDAKNANEKSETLDKFENDLIGNGNTENILKAIKHENPNSFNKLVDNYLPVLAKVDEKAYHHILGNITKHTIIAMVKEARNSNNEALQSAAQILNQFVFGSSDFSPPTNLSKKDTAEDDSKNKEFEKRQQEFVRKQLSTTVNDLNTRVNNTLKNTIDVNIDPKQSMTDYVRKNASKDALDMLQELIDKDTRFKSLADKLWEKAFESNFSKESVDRVRSAYLSKSKTLLPSVIKKARNEALRGMGYRRSKEESDNINDKSTNSSNKRGPIPAGRPRSNESRNSGKITKASDIPKDMRTLDFLNQD